jgi:bleomycin hydrolase
MKDSFIFKGTSFVLGNYVKNSWAASNEYDGYFYASESFVKYKTMNIVVHKDAIPKDLKKKMGIK